MIVRQTEAGTTWSELAKLDPLAAVLDPQDGRGGKNRLIDRVHKRALARAAGDISGARVLDFGCGTGRLSKWLVARGADVAGVDVTTEMVDVARRLVPEARFQTTSGQTLPFEDGTFDLVVTAYVLQYYVTADATVPRELSRVLAPNGRALAIEQVAEGDIGRGATRGAYERMFVDAGFARTETAVIRVGDSKVFELARRFPVLSRAPALPWLATREAAHTEPTSLTGDRYADALFHARKAR